MAGSGAADDIIKGILKALEESRASSKVGEVAGAAESGLRDIITKLVEDAKGVAGVKPPKPPKPPKTPTIASAATPSTKEMLGMGKSAYERGTQKGLSSLSPEEMYYAMHYAESAKLPQLHTKPSVSAMPNEVTLSPKKLKSIENQRLHAAANEARIAELKASGMDRASRRIRNVEAHAAAQEAKYGKGKGSNRATERDNIDIPKAPKTPKAPKVEEVKPKRARSANSMRLQAENDLLDMRANKNTFTKDEFAQGLRDAKNDGAKLTKKEQDILDMYLDTPPEML